MRRSLRALIFVEELPDHESDDESGERVARYRSYDVCQERENKQRDENGEEQDESEDGGHGTTPCRYGRS